MEEGVTCKWSEMDQPLGEKYAFLPACDLLVSAQQLLNSWNAKCMLGNKERRQ